MSTDTQNQTHLQSTVMLHVTGQSQEIIDPIQDTWEYSKGNPEFGQKL